MSSIAWDQQQVFWTRALHQRSSTHNCSTTTAITAAKQNISCHCWHLCPSNSSRHGLDVLGLKTNRALPASPQKSCALGAWLGRRTIWVTNQAEEWCCGHTEHHFPHATNGLSPPGCVPQMGSDTMIGALLTLCTSILILLFIQGSLLCTVPFERSVRRWQLHGRWSPVFSLMDSKTKSYTFCNLWAHAKTSRCLLHWMCTDTALNHNAKFCSKGFMCKKAEQEVTLNIKKKKLNHNCACTFTCW